MQKIDRTLMGLTMGLSQVSRAYIAASSKIAGGFQLSHASAWPVLMLGRMGDGTRPGVLAEALGLEPPSLVRVIEQLVEAGLMQRRDDPLDRRAKTLHLTPTGRECAQQLEEALIPFRRKLFAKIAPEDIEACVRILSKLGEAIAEFETAHAARQDM